MINILILNWKSAASIRQCLNHVLASDDPHFRIILINNFSSNSDLAEMRNIYNQLKKNIEIYLVENVCNLGYAGGNNEGFKYLKNNNITGDLLVLNPDIVISKNTISEMRKALGVNIGIVTVRTINPEGKILFDAIKLNGFFQKSIISRQGNIETDYSQGSCMLINREIINKVGLFDERFFLYWEEVDFSMRVRKSGWQLISITTTSVIRNNNNIDRQPLAFYYSVRNARLIRENHLENFSKTSYILYLVKIFLLMSKFIFRPKLFFSVISNYFSAIHDSYYKIYYSKPE